jgi:hypothetical protein
MENSKQGARAAIEKASGSFLKKNQKTLTMLALTYPENPAQVAKVFWFFFSKKNRLLSR